MSDSNERPVILSIGGFESGGDGEAPDPFWSDRRLDGVVTHCSSVS